MSYRDACWPGRAPAREAVEPARARPHRRRAVDQGHDRRPVTASASASLFYGAPAVAFVLHTAAHPAYAAMLAGSGMTAAVLDYLVALSEPVCQHGESLPGWWSGSGPASTPDQAWTEARKQAVGAAQYRSPLGRRPYDLRHAAVSLWLNSGVPATEVARRAGHGATEPEPDPATKATPTTSRQSEVAGQQPVTHAEWSAHRSSGRSGYRSCARRPCPSVDFKDPDHGAHGRIADGGGPESGLETHKRWSPGGDSDRASGL